MWPEHSQVSVNALFLSKQESHSKHNYVYHETEEQYDTTMVKLQNFIPSTYDKLHLHMTIKHRYSPVLDPSLTPVQTFEHLNAYKLAPYILLICPVLTALPVKMQARQVSHHPVLYLCVYLQTT